MINYGRQSISTGDIDAVVDVLKSDFLTTGPAVQKFEERISTLVNAPHSIVCSNATAALHLACLALGVNESSRVWTSANSFVSSANCARMCGASIDFFDVDVKTGNVDLEKLKAKLKKASEQGELPDVLIPVHFSGRPVDMAAFSAIVSPYKIRVIEDASHAIGASTLSGSVGDCEYSDVTVFSFHPVKIITTGEGGCCTTQSAELAEKIRSLRSHGVHRNIPEFSSLSGELWEYEQTELGFNYRLTDIQAALGSSQLKRIKDFVGKRREVAEQYEALLKGVCELPPSDQQYSSWHLYCVRFENADQRRRVYNKLREHQIFAQVHYIPIYKQPYYRKLGFSEDYLPGAEQWYNQCLSLPMHTELSNENLQQISTIVESEQV